MSLCEKCAPRELAAMRALESLTPSGSEFVNEIQRCVSHIRDHQRTTVEFAKRTKWAREALGRVLLSSTSPYTSNDKAEVFDEMEQRLEEITRIVQEALAR